MVIGAVVTAGAVRARDAMRGGQPVAIACDADLKRLPVDSAHPELQTWDCAGSRSGTRWIMSGERVMERATLANGKLEGEVVRTPSDSERVEGAYADGQPAGVWRAIREGIVESDERFVDGKRNGRAHRFSPDGGVVEEQVWADDEKHGAFASYGANGHLVLSGSFEHGHPAGRWTRYDPQGRAIEVWLEPRAKGTTGASDNLALTTDDASEELYAGQSLGRWKLRLAELRLDPKMGGDPELTKLLLHRAELAGLVLNEEGTLVPR
jgi:hypothetical protein